MLGLVCCTITCHKPRIDVPADIQRYKTYFFAELRAGRRFIDIFFFEKQRLETSGKCASGKLDYNWGRASHITACDTIVLGNIRSWSGGGGGSADPLRDITRSISVSRPLAVAASVVNGAYEELFLVGFIFKALERYDLKFIIGVSVLLRIIAHVYQGPIGALGIFSMGVLFAFVYARYRQIWPLIVAHVGADMPALVR